MKLAVIQKNEAYGQDLGQLFISGFLVDGAKRVAGGGKIDLEGVFSTLTFDPKFGEAPSDAQVWCVGIDPNTAKAFFNEAMGQYYDSTGDNLVGAFACP